LSGLKAQILDCYGLSPPDLADIRTSQNAVKPLPCLRLAWLQELEELADMIVVPKRRL